MSLHWVESVHEDPRYGFQSACGECVIRTARLVFTIMGDGFTEEDLATPESALALMDTLDDNDGAGSSHPVDVFYNPAPGTQCPKCGAIAGERQSV